jgi:hypothetical protein
MVNWIYEEVERSGREFNAVMVTLIRIGMSEKMAEYEREKNAPKEIVIKEYPAEISEEEQAQMDKLLSAEPSKDHERNQVAFKRQEA